jgi:glycosyltransferase involved in cell wall biosynthesis
MAKYMADVIPTRLVSFAEKSDSFTEGRLEVRIIGRPWHVQGQKTNPMSAHLFRELAWGDVIHAHQTHVLASSATAAFARLTSRRVFTTDLGGGGWDVSSYMNTDRWFHGHLHICEYSQTISGHEGCPWARPILAGVDTEKFCPDPSATRDGRAVMIGRILPHKGANYVIEGVDADQPLEIIGRPYAPPYFHLLQKLALGKSVTFRTECRDDEIVDAHRRAIVSILASVYQDLYGARSSAAELLPLTLLEAMSCGTPVIGTRMAGIPEIIVDGETGILVPMNDPRAIGDAVRFFRQHPGEVSRMGANARRRVLERFTWPAVIERCLAAYRGVTRAVA